MRKENYTQNRLYIYIIIIWLYPKNQMSQSKTEEVIGNKTDYIAISAKINDFRIQLIHNIIVHIMFYLNYYYCERFRFGFCGTRVGM